MNFFIVISYFFGIYLASLATSFHVKHEARHEQRTNRSMEVRETASNTGEKIVSTPIRLIDGRQSTQSMVHSKHKLDIFPQEFLINLNNEEGKNNSLPDLDDKQGQNDYINKYGEKDKSKKDKDSAEDAALIWITGDNEEKLKIQTYESDDQQSGDGFTPGEFSELDANLQMESNMNIDKDGGSSKEFINIPVEIDEDLKYVLNSTYDHYMDSELLQKKTYKDQKNLKGALLDSKKETSKNNGENDNGNSNSRVNNENEFVISAKKDTNITRISSDIAFMMKKEAEEETTDTTESKASGSDESEYHNKMIKYGQRENITHSYEKVDVPLNNSNVEIIPKQTAGAQREKEAENRAGAWSEIHSTLKKKNKNVETNKTKLADPCANFHCKMAKTCNTDANGDPFCACQEPELCQPTNLNDRVCGTDNKTYSSDCHLFATKCQLEGKKEGSHLHLDYQGPCKFIPPCTDYELAHFPFRMRDWLKNVLMQLYERCLENPGLLSEKQINKVKKIYENEKRLQEGDHNIELLAKDFQKNYHMYVFPVHWQFNQLDRHSIDRLLTRSELSALRAPLMPMEHCVSAFLHGCNTNKDKHISLEEWCHCFGIRDGDIDENLLF